MELPESLIKASPLLLLVKGGAVLLTISSVLLYDGFVALAHQIHQW